MTHLESTLHRTSTRRSLARASGESHHLGGEADDLHELALTQLAGDSTEDARAAWIQLVVNEDHRVAVETDVTAVIAAPRLARPHDHALDDVSRLDVAARHRLLDAGDDDIAESGVTAPR